MAQSTFLELMLNYPYLDQLMKTNISHLILIVKEKENFILSETDFDIRIEHV